MHTYRATLYLQQPPERVWDLLHQPELIAILFDQRIRRILPLDGTKNHTGYRVRYELMSAEHDPTLSLLAEILAQHPYNAFHLRLTWDGATYLLHMSWKPRESGCELSIALETNYISPFLNLQLLFSKKRYLASFDARFAELVVWMNAQT